jgi:3-hydroxyacyl-CoA dehydrogenase
MNRARLLADAKAKALSLVEGYQPRQPVALKLPGETARVALKMAVDGFVSQGKATPHDVVVSRELARVVSGGDTDVLDEVTEKQLLALERHAFMNLIRMAPTLDRIEHMLETGKPLRN